MTWLEILQGVEGSVSAEVRTSGTFDPSKLRLIGAKIQKDLAVQSHCLDDGYYAFTTVASQMEYTAPVDMLVPRDVRVGVVPQYGLTRRPVYPTDLTGQAVGLYQRGRYFGLYPAPSSALDAAIWYFRKPPLYAMSVWFDSDTHTTIDTCYMDVFDDHIGISTVNVSSTGVDYNFTFATADTIADMVTLINAQNANGIYAKMFNECTGNELCTSLEQREDINIKIGGNTLPPNRDVIAEQKPRLFFEPEIPDEAQEIIELGIIYKLKTQDREMSAAQLEQSEYYMKFRAFVNQYRSRRQNALNNHTVRKLPMMGMPTTPGLKVFVP